LIILDTDYVNYAVVFSCAEFFNFTSIHYAWIFSRTRTLSAEFKAKSIQAFTKAEVDTVPLIVTDQSCGNDKTSGKEEKKSVKASEKSEKKSGKTTKKQDKTTKSPKSSATTAKKSENATTKKKN